MKRTIDTDLETVYFKDLTKANSTFQKIYPGDRTARQPVHTVYGGAHLFKKNATATLAQRAREHMLQYAPNFAIFAKAFQLKGAAELPENSTAIEVLNQELAQLPKAELAAHPAALAWQVYHKVLEKLEREAVEDFRIDFEDGYGNRTDDEEDQEAIRTALEVAKGMKEATLPPFIGIRIKPFTEDMKERGLRTLDIFLSTLLDDTTGQLPDNFVIMLPKVTIPAQPKALAKFLRVFERQYDMPKASIKMEMMVETTQSIMAADGRNPLRRLVKASKGRCIAMHFGTYDYTASCNITAHYQTMDHPVCDFAHHMTKVALAHTGIWLSDGATNIMPVGPHRGSDLTKTQQKENEAVVYRAWKQAYDHIRHSLWNGYYQGWDLNPAQLPIRYAAVYSFFLESMSEATERLHSFIEKAARASLSGDIFDDAATGQGLLNYFLRALNSGAINEQDIEATGLSLEEIRTRSFAKILEGRKGKEI